jgi:hypothetical protein
MLEEILPEMELNGETHLQDGQRYSGDKGEGWRERRKRILN